MALGTSFFTVPYVTYAQIPSRNSAIAQLRDDCDFEERRDLVELTLARMYLKRHNSVSPRELSICEQATHAFSAIWPILYSNQTQMQYR